MKERVRSVISIIILIAFLFSSVCTDILRISAEEISIGETVTNEETQSLEQEETTQSGLISRETTLEETTTEEVVYNVNQQRIVEQINSIPEITQDDFFDKVKALYLDYLTLTEDEIMGISKEENEKYESILASAAAINHTDEYSGISVEAEGLPWYVKVQAHKTDETIFRENYDSYINSLYEEKWEEDWDSEEYDEDWDYEDEEYLDDEEDEDWDSEEDEEWIDDEYSEYEDDEDWTDEELEDEYKEDETYEELEEQEWMDLGTDILDSPILNLGYNEEYDFSTRFMDTYDISLYDTLLEAEYTMPEGMKVKVSITYKKEYLGNSIDILHLKADGVYEDIEPWLYNKDLDKILTYGLYEELYGEEEYFDKDIEDYYDEDYWTEEYSEEGEEYYEDEEYLEDMEEIDKYFEEAYKKYVEDYKEWAKEQNKKYNVDDYLIQFETDSFSEFAVCLNRWVYKTTNRDNGAIAPQADLENVSPKTGINIIIPFVGIMCSTILIFICIPFYRKRKDDIV